MINRYGTTSDMVIQTLEVDGASCCLAIDAGGLYLTKSSYLDTQLADPNRYAVNRKSIAERLAALGLNPAELASANKHRIPTITAEAQKKVNPLKASKRAAKKG